MSRVEWDKDRLGLPNSIRPAKDANSGIPRMVVAVDAIQTKQPRKAAAHPVTHFVP
jgi:hypothetical protein